MSGPPDSPVFFTDRDLGKQFPAILSDAGLTVMGHTDLFEPACPDEIWLAEVGAKGWVAITRDRHIRYKPNEKQAVLAHGVRLLVVVGRAPLADLADNFVATIAKINEFVGNHAAPWIGKVYRPPGVAPKGTPGSVALWLDSTS